MNKGKHRKTVWEWDIQFRVAHWPWAGTVFQVYHGEFLRWITVLAFNQWFVRHWKTKKLCWNNGKKIYYSKVKC